MLGEEQMMDHLSDDVSDTGWDTDLEIEGETVRYWYTIFLMND